MSSKVRVLSAVALCLEDDREKAEGILRKLMRDRDSYLMCGEVESDIALMSQLLV